MLEFRNEIVEEAFAFVSYEDALYIANSYIYILQKQFLNPLNQKGVDFEIIKDSENYIEWDLLCHDDDIIIEKVVIGYNILEAFVIENSPCDRYRQKKYFKPFNFNQADIILMCLVHELGHLNYLLNETSLKNYHKTKALWESQALEKSHAEVDFEVEADLFAFEYTVRCKEEREKNENKMSFRKL